MPSFGTVFFVFWGLDTPGPQFREISRERARRSRRKRSRRSDSPLGPQRLPVRRTFSRRSAKADPSAGLLHGEVRKPTTPQDFPSAKRKSRPARWASSRRSAKVGPGGRLCPSPGFGRAAGPGGGENASLPYSARKSQFLRNGDVPATESLFLFAVLWLAFLPGQSETGVAGGGKARRPETPTAPRRPRPTTATGSRFLRRQRERPPRRPRPSPPAREGSLGAPNDRTFPPGAERKARKGKEKERRKPHAAPTPGLARPLRLMRAGRLLASIHRIAPRRSATGRLANQRFATLGSQPKRAQRRGKPAK